MKWCVWVLLVVLALSEFSRPSFGYPNGAPRNRKVCRTLKPHHLGAYPQQSTAPFKITPSKTKVAVNESVKVTISATSGTSYKGFIMQARPRMIYANYIKPIGTFKLLNTSISKTLNCLSGVDNTVTHSSPVTKTSTTFTWTPPPNYKGNVYFRASFVKDFSTFWVNVSSSIVVNSTETDAVTDENDFSRDNSIIVYQEMYGNCGLTKACFGIPEKCEMDGSCDMLVAVSVQGSKFEFELLGQDVKFVSVSLTESGQLDTESLTTCALINNTVTLRQFPFYQNQYDNVLNGNETLINSSYVDGTIYCKFQKDETMELNSVHHDMRTTRYFLALAAGSNEMQGDDIDFNRVLFHISPKRSYLTDVTGFSKSFKTKGTLKEKYWNDLNV